MIKAIKIVKIRFNLCRMCKKAWQGGAKNVKLSQIGSIVKKRTASRFCGSICLLNRSGTAWPRLTDDCTLL